MKCIFCQNELDESDEHIIPDSLNGKLHSKYIICQNCNTNIFSQGIDRYGKEYFNRFLLLLGFKNASGAGYFFDAEGEKYVLKKDNKMIQVKPKIKSKEIDGKLHFEVSGVDKNAFKLLKKEIEKLEKEKGQKFKGVETKVFLSDGVPMRSEKPIEIKPQLKLLMNKIAFEYLAYEGVNLDAYSHQLNQVFSLDTTISNVYICNLQGDLRNFDEEEISHLIKIIVFDKHLLVYIELFNVLCCIVKIDNDFTGNGNYEQYYQNAISGESINKNVDLDLDKVLSIISNDPAIFEKANISYLDNRVQEVKRLSDFNIRLREEFEKSKPHLDTLKNTLSREKYEVEFGKMIAKHMAHLTVEEFPYLFDEFDDENNNHIHYIHSNLREEQYEEFCDKNNHLIGTGIIDPDDKKFVITGFEKYSFKVKNGVSIVKVFVVVEGESGKHRIKYREVFEMQPIFE